MKEYQFENGGYDIRINRLDLPYPWVNYLTNTRLSAMVSQAGGAFLWYLSPVKLRITRYRYHQLPNDAPGFYVYIKEENGDMWCPTFQPMQDAETQRYTLHRPGETVFVATHGETRAELSLFIPPDDDVLVWELTLTNLSGAERKYDVYAYSELSQFDWRLEQSLGYYWQHMLRTRYDNDAQVLFYTFNFVQSDFYHKHAPLVYFASDEPVVSFCGDRDSFVGCYRSEANPKAIEADVCDNKEISSGNPCAVIHISKTCGAGETSDCRFLLGVSEGALVDYESAKAAALQAVNRLRSKKYAAQLKMDMQARYVKHFEHFECDIPDKEIQRQINIWGPLNALQFSLFHQTPQPSAPGIRAIGARDKLQALMPITYRNVAGAMRGLLYMLSSQYINGAIAHENQGYMYEYIRVGKYKRESIKSDDHLWSIFLAYAVAAESDTDFLYEKLPYTDLDGKPTSETETVWEHLVRVIEFTQGNLGAHGLPLMLSGDWNDIINKFSSGGKGESVFAAQQYVVALDKMAELAGHIGKYSDKERFEDYRRAQAESILRCGWNGKWWYRCFDDDGKPIGSETDKFGRLWLNPQSWAILSGICTEEQKESSFGAVERMLDTDCGLQLLTPGFASYPDDMDPFSPYNPGTGENGAIFCHAHTWAIIAEAKRGNADKAWKYYCDLLPFKLCERLGIDVYQSDPYGWVSNIVGKENGKHGWGNVIRFTGTAVWMNIAATQYLLGVRTRLDGLKLDPCIPADWKEYSVRRDYIGCRVNVTFKNPDGATGGVRCVDIDGKRYCSNILPRALFEGRRSADVTVYM